MAVFQSGDIVRLRSFNRSAGSLTIGNCWGVVTSYADQSDGTQTWTFTRSAGGNAGGITAGTVINADSIVLDYGTTGNGFWEVNAIDGAYATNSPYSQIVTWTTHPATGSAVRLRMGNLAGVSISDYGLVMGTDVSDASTTSLDFRASTGTVRLGPVGSSKPNWYWDGTDMRLRLNTTTFTKLSTSGLELFGSDGTARITLDNSGAAYVSGVLTIGTSGEIRQGTGTLGSDYTGLRIWRDSSVGRIAGYNTNTLQWYANTSGELAAGGGNVIMSATGFDLSAHQATGVTKSKTIAWWSDVDSRSGTDYLSAIYTKRDGIFTSQDMVMFARGSGASYPNGQVLLTANRYDDSANTYFSLLSSGTATLAANLITDGWLTVYAHNPAGNPVSGGTIYVDESDGDLKVRFANGTIKTITTN